MRHHHYQYVQVSGPDAKLYINAITTLVFFIISLALVIRPSIRLTDQRLKITCLIIKFSDFFPRILTMRLKVCVLGQQLL